MSSTPGSDDDIHPVSRHFLWLDKPWARQAPFYIFGGLALVLLGLDFIHHRHAQNAIEAIPGFYVWMGFFGFCLAVLAGWPLRWLLARRPDYYERTTDDE